MLSSQRLLSVLSALAMGGCVSMPTGPSVMVLPGSTKSFEQFRVDDTVCQQYALEQIGGKTLKRTAMESAVSSAAVGTVVGAAAGAAMGGHEGAGVGAGTGLLLGSAAGAGAAERSTYGMQRRYDFAYMQCMYAKGHRVPVPVPAQLTGYPAHTSPYATPPPPPAGSPPPPPPDVVK